MESAGISERILIPDDGEQLQFDRDSDVPPTKPHALENLKPGFQKWLTAKFAGT
jgi:hypothetical protein